MRTKPGLLHNKRGPMQLSCSQVAVNPVRNGPTLEAYIGSLCLGRVVLAVVIAQAALVREHLCWTRYASYPCCHDHSAYGASTGSSGKRTDIPQTDCLVHLLIWNLVCSSPWWVYSQDTDVFTLCTHSQRSTSPQTPFVTSLPIWQEPKSLHCPKLYLLGFSITTIF